MSEFVPLPEEINLLRALRGTPNAQFMIRTNEYGKIQHVKVERVLTETIVNVTKIRVVQDAGPRGA
jgi:hypothetical protein